MSRSSFKRISNAIVVAIAALLPVTPAFAATFSTPDAWPKYVLYSSLGLLLIGLIGKLISMVNARRRGVIVTREPAGAGDVAIGAYRMNTLTQLRMD